VDPEEEAAAAASSGDDEFFDRTAGGRARKLRGAAAPALDAATLYGRKARPAGAQPPGWRPAAWPVPGRLQLLPVLLQSRPGCC